MVVVRMVHDQYIAVRVMRDRVADAHDASILLEHRRIGDLWEWVAVADYIFLRHLFAAEALARILFRGVCVTDRLRLCRPKSDVLRAERKLHDYGDRHVEGWIDDCDPDNHNSDHRRR